MKLQWQYVLALNAAWFLMQPQQTFGASITNNYIATAANGMGIPHPASNKTYRVMDGDCPIEVPEAMAYIPAGKFTFGSGTSATIVELKGYCLGKYPVTNAEFKEFLNANPSYQHPTYWNDGIYPTGKGNHPVVYVSLEQAQAYAAWVSKQTGWKVVIPTSQQWEKAARGQQGLLYPWGNSQDTHYANGILTTRFNYNAVTAAEYLKKQPTLTVTYNNPKSTRYGTKTTLDKIAGYDNAGNPTYLTISPNGSVQGWVSHATYTGFIYTDLFSELNSKGGNTTPVGSYENGKSSYGCYDMAGNVWNWCDTKIVAQNGAERGRTVNEIRGGSWYATGRSCCSVSIGEGRAASGAYNTVGFRIAMLPVK